MKNFVLTSIFIISALFSIAQEKLNFMTFGFYRVDVTNNPKIKLPQLINTNPSEELGYWDGFNHYEIDLKKKVLIHIYVGESQGEVIKIKNLVKTNNYYLFDVKSKVSGDMSFLIPINKKSKYRLLVKYKIGNNTRVALFNHTSTKTPF
jgi:hypothetical protein